MKSHEKIISICEVSNEENRIIRICDVDNGHFRIPSITRPYKGYNRDKLFYDQQRFSNIKPGWLGVWEWYVDNDDRIESTFLETYIPCEVIEQYISMSEKELRDKLIKGLKLRKCNHNRLFLFQKENDKDENGEVLTFRAILCQPTQWQEYLDGIRLNDDIYALKCFEINGKDILKIGSSVDTSITYLYNSFKLPNEFSWILIQSPNNIIRDLLLKRFNNRFLKENSISRKDGSQLHNLILQITEDEIQNQIASICHVSTEYSNQYWQKIKNNLNEIIKCEDIDSNILKNLLKCDSELKKKLIDTWYKIYADDLKKKKDEIIKEQEKLKNKKEILSKELDNIRLEYEKEVISIQKKTQAAKDALKKAQDDAEYYEYLGKESLRLVREKLSIARKEAAEFLADIAVFGSPNEQIHTTSSSFFFQPSKLAETQETVYNIEEHIEILEDNLQSIGAIHEKELAYFLYASFRMRTPLLLAGSQGVSMAHALSCAMTGRYAAVLDCCGQWTPSVLENIKHDESTIFVIRYPFTHRWIDHLIYEINNIDKMFIFVHPYMNDLKFETADLYSYVFPIISDIFIAKKPNNNLIGCEKSYDFENAIDHLYTDTINDRIELITKNPFIRKRVRDIYSYIREQMNKECNDIFSFFCILFPLSVALDLKKILHEKISEENDLTSADKRLLSGVLGE